MASPLAKVLGREHKVDLAQIRGTGPDNRIIRDDVLEFVGKFSHSPFIFFLCGIVVLCSVVS